MYGGSFSFSKIPRLFCGPYEMMVNCFACGKDIGVSTERRSFSDERPSESKYVYFMLGGPWYKRSCLLVVIVLRASTIYSNHTPTKCADHALRATKELMNLMQCFETILEPF